MATVGPSPYAPDPKPLPPRSPVRGYQVTRKYASFALSYVFI